MYIGQPCQCQKRCTYPRSTSDSSIFAIFGHRRSGQVTCSRADLIDERERQCFTAAIVDLEPVHNRGRDCHNRHPRLSLDSTMKYGSSIGDRGCLLESDPSPTRRMHYSICNGDAKALFAVLSIVVSLHDEVPHSRCNTQKQPGLLGVHGKAKHTALSMDSSSFLLILCFFFPMLETPTSRKSRRDEMTPSFPYSCLLLLPVITSFFHTDG